MDSTVKRTIAVIVIILVLGVAIYGSYLPLRKAEIYIDTLQALQTPATAPTSLQDLETRVSVPLNYPSPIGQEELVRNFANSVLSFVQEPGIDATSTSELITYLNSYYDPILNAGRGMSFGQDLYLEGAINEVAFAHVGNPMYLIAAQNYYKEAQADGPNRPQALYGLFDVYSEEGNVTGTVAVADTILAIWPTDTTIGPALQKFLQEVSTTPARG